MKFYLKFENQKLCNCQKKRCLNVNKNVYHYYYEMQK